MNAKHTILIALFTVACGSEVDPYEYGYGDIAWSENEAAPVTSQDTDESRNELGWFAAPETPVPSYTGDWVPEDAWAGLPLTPGYYTMTPTAVTASCGGEAEVGTSYQVELVYEADNDVLKMWHYAILNSGGEGVLTGAGTREGDLPDTSCFVTETVAFDGVISAENTFSGHLTETRTGDSGCDAQEWPVDCTNDFEADFVFITPDPI